MSYGCIQMDNFLSSPVSSKTTVNSSILQEADKLYSDKKYDAAYEKYNMFVNGYPNSRDAERSLYRMILIDYRRENWQEFLSDVKGFLRKYPKSRYKVSVMSHLASFYNMKGMVVKSVETLIKAWPYIKTEKERTVIENQIKTILTKNKGRYREELYNLCLRYRRTEGSELVLYMLGKDTKKENNKYWNLLKEINPNSKYLPQTSRKISPVKKSSFSICVMMPLSDMDEKERSIYNGVMMAIDEYNFPKGNIIKADTKRDPYVAAKLVQRVINDYGVDAIVGPIYSDVVLPVSLYSSVYNVPVISPLATNQKLYEISDNVFLINTAYVPVARTLADYAYYLNKSNEGRSPLRIGILYPDTYKGKTLSDYFVQFLRHNGMDIVSAVSYNPDTTDFRKPIKKLLKTSPDIIFVPAESREIPLIAPQLLYHYIEEWQMSVEEIEKDTTLSQEVIDSLKDIKLNEVLSKITILGSDGWLSDNVLRLPKQYTMRVVACKLPVEENSKFVEFGKRYYKRYKEEPTREAALGYDAASLILNEWEKGYRKDLVKVIKSEVSYSGIAGDIGIVDNGKVLPLYIIKNGAIKEISMEVKNGKNKEE